MIPQIICILLVSSFNSINGQNEEKPEQINAEIGQEQVLECPQTIAAGKNCTWSEKKRGSIVESDDIYQFLNSTRCELKIRKIIDANDGETFICAVTNNIRHSFQITTFKTPENYIEYNGKTYHHSTKVLYEKDNNKVTCVSKGGKPQPEISWRINGEPQPSPNEIDEDTVKSELTFILPPMSYGFITNSSVEVEVDCEISYNSTKGLKTINTGIVIGPQWDVTKVEIKREELNLTCSADGNPTPTEYRIQKLQKDGKWDEGHKITKDNPVFKISDEGKFRCLVMGQQQKEIVSNVLSINATEVKIDASTLGAPAIRSSVGSILLLALVAIIVKMIDSI